MEINVSKKDIIWSYLGIILSMGANFLLLPFIVYYLDGDSLGLWYVFISVGQIATLFDFGFSVTFARNVTYCWSGANELMKTGVVNTESNKVNYILFKKVLYCCKYIYKLISLIALVVLFTLGSLYICKISANMSGHSHLIAWGIYALATVLNIYYGYYTSFLRGVGAVGLANENTVYARGIHIVITILLLYCGFGLLGACIAYLTYGVVFRLLGKYRFYHYKNIGENLKDVKQECSYKDTKNIMSIIWHNAWRDGVISLSNFLSSQASTIVCSLYLGLHETGVYSLGVQISSAVALIAGALYNTMQPSLQQAFIQNDLERMRKVMSSIVVTFVYIFCAVALGTVLFGLPILRIVKPTAIISGVLFSMLCLYQFILVLRNIYTSYFSCTNRIIYMKSFLYSSVLSILCSCFTVGFFKFGIYGLILSQIFSQLVFNAWYWMLKGNRELRLNLHTIFNLGNAILASKIKVILNKV